MKYKLHKQYRLPGYDYSSNGDYFITICTKNHIDCFGKIIKTEKDQIMVLSPIGEYVKQAILAIPSKYPNMELGEWVIMPNHVHFVLSIRLPADDQNIPTITSCRDRPWPVPTQQEGLQSIVKGSVSSAVNHFKGDVKKWCNRNGYIDFNWQARFHDHIIRNDESYNEISNYIANNILNWDSDSLYNYNWTI